MGRNERDGHGLFMRSWRPQTTTDGACLREKTPFVVYGWQWHHVAIVRELRRTCYLAERAQAACCGRADVRKDAEGRAVVALMEALRFVIDDVWRVHDFVEERLLFPWIRMSFASQASASRDPTQSRKVSALLRNFESQRRELRSTVEEINQRLDKRFRSLNSSSSASAQNVKTPARAMAPQSCEMFMRDIRGELCGLTERTARFYEREEHSLAPTIAQRYDEAEQRRYNARVLNTLSFEDKRLSIVYFSEALRKTEGKEHDAPPQSDYAYHSAREELIRAFWKEIPPFVQPLIPVWRRVEYDSRSAALRRFPNF